MTWFLFDVAALAAGYVLAIYSWPRLRLRLIALRHDPVATIEKDIAALRAFIDKIKGA